MKYQKEKVSLQIPYYASNLILNLLNKHYTPAALHLRSQYLQTPMQNLFIFVSVPPISLITSTSSKKKLNLGLINAFENPFLPQKLLQKTNKKSSFRNSKNVQMTLCQHSPSKCHYLSGFLSLLVYKLPPTRKSTLSSYLKFYNFLP